MATRKTGKAKKASTAKRAPAQAGNGGETHQRFGDGDITTNHGIPLADNQNSLRVGRRGPTLLEDFALREKIFHFDHERIPERIVHARGSGAGGYFELTDSLEEFTTARILTEVGERTEVYARFSTVAGGAGSVDTPRDVRGFAVKFYTRDGNWDLVGNNIPVFFIQDAIKFPDLIHSVKMEADRAYPQAASAHDTFWDFISLMPESHHMVLWAMSDRAIPRSLRMMEGFGVNTFRLVDAEGRFTFVKFHWRPELGLQSTCWDEAVKIAGADPDYHRRDLFEAIDRGDFPAWTFHVQLITQEEADDLPFDILDATKVVPEELFPLRKIGRMVLDRNPGNFFAETEQVAFLPSNVPPGIDFSEDPLLQGRLFSYQDTQLSRLGSTNFHQIPVNSAKGCPFANFQRDGHMQTMIPTGRANYEPNSLAEAGEPGGPRETDRGIRPAVVETSGEKQRIRAETFADHYSQARMFYASQNDTDRDHIVSAIVFELSKVTLPHVRSRMVGHLVNISPNLARRVADGLGMRDVPDAPDPGPTVEMDPSPALGLIGKYPDTLEGRSVALLVAEGSPAKTVKAVTKAVKSAGGTPFVVAPTIEGVELDDGSRLDVDGQLDGSPSVLFDAVALIVAGDAAGELASRPAAVGFVADAFSHLKAIGHTGDAKALLDAANVTPDDRVVTLGKPAAFAEAAAGRQWDREPKLRPAP